MVGLFPLKHQSSQKWVRGPARTRRPRTPAGETFPKKRPRERRGPAHTGTWIPAQRKSFQWHMLTSTWKHASSSHAASTERKSEGLR